VFTLAQEEVSEGLAAVLAEHGLSVEDGTLILSRDLHRSGRTVARVNGRAVPVSVLQQIGQALVDIHGQSEHLSLLRASYQLDLLDDYAGALALRARVAESVAELRRVRRELEQLTIDERELARRADLLRFQVDEIDAARLQPGEEDDLRQERVLLVNAEKLASGADAAYQALYSGEGEAPAALDRLGEAQALLDDLAKLDPSLQPHVEAITAAVYQVEEVGSAMRSYRDTVEFNPERLQAVEERIDLILTLQRKYGSSIEEILKYGQQAASELDSLVHGEERRVELLEQEKALVQATGALAAELSAVRHRAASDLARAIEGELADLNMKGAGFEVTIERLPDEAGLPLEPSGNVRFAFDATGADRVSFAISPNPGEPLKPLAKIASGGEMSRLLLALKTVLSRADRIGTLIFDEVDVGVGGRSGRVIGVKLSGLAERHQVICVTHLPQIACFADGHYKIAKVVSGGRTSTQVDRLDSSEQVEELATMMAGTAASATARQSAVELIADANNWKEKARAAKQATARHRA
jgi:DNA repair protein RecN (Recombination protein N)